MKQADESRHYGALDQRLREATRDIRILSTLAWSDATEQRMLAAWREGKCRLADLPAVEYPRKDFAAARKSLDELACEASGSHPLDRYFRRNVEAWQEAAQMLESAGQTNLTGHSVALYGRPGDRIPGSKQTNLDAARHFLAVADELGVELAAQGEQKEYSAAELAEQLTEAIDALFGVGVVRVEVDPELTSKAAAGSERIRVRGNTRYSRHDRDQLLAHEALVHTLTAQNGRAQPCLASLARSSPRVTATQEGLAVFAELMSGALDIARLKRISLRILAIDMALEGADFIEVCHFLLAHGQDRAEAFQSAQRVFRGVPLAGGAAFTKDNVYLAGLLSVHTFFRWAFRHRKIALLRNLFAGKMALEDVLDLEPAFESGLIAPPRFLPPWVEDLHGLSGKLAFSVFVNRIRMQRVEAGELTLAL